MLTFIYIPEPAGAGRRTQRICRLLANVQANAPDLYQALCNDISGHDRILTQDDQIFNGFDLFDQLDNHKKHL